MIKHNRQHHLATIVGMTEGGDRYILRHVETREDGTTFEHLWTAPAAWVDESNGRWRY